MIVDIQKFSSEPETPASSYRMELERIAALEPFAGVTFMYLRVRQHWLFTSDPDFLSITDAQAVRDVAGRHAILVLDLSWEGIAYTDAVGSNIKTLMVALGLSPDQVVLVQTSAVLANEIAQSDAPAEVKAIRLAWFHTFLYDLALAAQTERLFDVGHARIEAPGSPHRMFLCLNAAPRPPRLAVVYTIASHPQRDRFYCTFHASSKGKAGIDNAAQPACSYLGGKVTPDEVKSVVRSHHFDDSVVDPTMPGALVATLEPELYAQTRMSIVTETEMTDGNRQRFTEKSIKPLLMGHPVLIFGNPGVLEQLEAFGFDLLRDHIPADYDAIAARRKRLRRGLKIVDELLHREFDPHASRDIRARLHSNVAQFEGPLMERVRTQATGSMLEATAPYRAEGLVE